AATPRAASCRPRAAGDAATPAQARRQTSRCVDQLACIETTASACGPRETVVPTILSAGCTEQPFLVGPLELLEIHSAVGKAGHRVLVFRYRFVEMQVEEAGQNEAIDGCGEVDHWLVA